MPALPWIQVGEPESDVAYVVMASRLPLRSYARIPSFLRATWRIRRQLATAGGLIGYSLDAKVWVPKTSSGAVNRMNVFKRGRLEQSGGPILLMVVPDDELSHLGGKWLAWISGRPWSAHRMTVFGTHNYPARVP